MICIDCFYKKNEGNTIFSKKQKQGYSDTKFSSQRYFSAK